MKWLVLITIIVTVLGLTGNPVSATEFGCLGQSTLKVSTNSIIVNETLIATVTVKNNEGLALADRTIQLFSSRNVGDYVPDIISSVVIADVNGMAFFTVTPTAIGDLTLTALNQTEDEYIPEEQTIIVAPIPEPSSILALMGGISGLALLLQRRKN